MRQIRHAIESGVNYIDTAWPYHRGESEKLLGAHILPEYRDRVHIATKLPCFFINKTARMSEIFEKQLLRLNTQTIDYYLLHALDGPTWQRMKRLGVIDFMDDLKRTGKVRHLGFSFHGESDHFKQIIDAYDWTMAQVQYNILDENYQAGLDGIRYAASKDIGIVVMEPLRGGSLVGRMPDSVAAVYAHAPIQRTPADWAFSWIYDHPEVTVVLSGMNDNTHIDENLAIADRARPGMLSDAERQVIADARRAFESEMTIGCTGCGYCMPCPQGINIPAALKDLNNAHMFGKAGVRTFHIGAFGVQTEDGRPHWAGSCIGCGACEKKCPQHLPIRGALRRVSRELETPLMKTLAAGMRWFMRAKKGAQT